MKYKIKYNYNTGDSFHNEEGLESYLELEWEKIEVAEANLLRIKEHYEQYTALNRLNYDRSKTVNDIIGYNKANKDWFVHSDKMTFEHQIILYTDDGKPWQIWAPWCGYFESLNFVEVEELKSKYSRYEF